jgi:hypothetical protein
MEDIKETLKRRKKMQRFSKTASNEIDRFEACFNKQNENQTHSEVVVLQIPIKKKTTQTDTEKMRDDFYYYQ